ncbi:sigma-70 family RNA polymerase sigma factor [uncultured Agrococcus sp.]|uniref:RNA polymerase sigma factor n=1 Tax=uncultured Agrococcus sp. TaxID=382258 RepID=UPI0025F174D4|nr:sigma-70 family RNA polymerase sigma factor [uncultured Agrococcus sp.]
MREYTPRISLADADDRILAGRAADGDVEAFTVLVRRHTPRLRAATRLITRSTLEVDDIVQESFVTAWQRLPDLEDQGKVQPWLMRIVTRNAISRVRASRPYQDIDDLYSTASGDTSPDRVVENRAQMAALRETLDGLPSLQRDCWVLREIGGYHYDEIAEQLGTSVSTVRGALARARRHIIVRMEAWR